MQKRQGCSTAAGSHLKGNSTPGGRHSCRLLGCTNTLCTPLRVAQEGGMGPRRSLPSCRESEEQGRWLGVRSVGAVHCDTTAGSCRGLPAMLHPAAHQPEALQRRQAAARAILAVPRGWQRAGQAGVAQHPAAARVGVSLSAGWPRLAAPLAAAPPAPVPASALTTCAARGTTCGGSTRPAAARPGRCWTGSAPAATAAPAPPKNPTPAAAPPSAGCPARQGWQVAGGGRQLLRRAAVQTPRLRGRRRAQLLAPVCCGPAAVRLPAGPAANP